MKKVSPSWLFFVVLSLGSVSAGFGQTTWDFGASPSKNWSAFTNWSTDLSPAGTPVIFGATGTTASATTIGNSVDQNFTIDSLTYNNTANWQVTDIASGVTLTVDAVTAPATTLLVGGYTTANTTQAAISGAGSLIINEPTAAFTVSNGGATASRATLDMSKLANFTATVSSVNVGTGTTSFGTLSLADNTTITAGTFLSGGFGSSYSASFVSNHVVFGTTTVLNVDTISFAQGRTVGDVKFNTGLTGATLKIRAADGVSRAALKVGDLTETSVAGTTGTSSLDLTGGSVDALLSTLTVGRSPSGLTSIYPVSMSVGAGVVDATSVVVGETIGTTTSNAGTLQGTLTMSGGTLTAGTVTLANNASGLRATKGTLNVSGTAAVNISGNLVLGNQSSATVVTPTVAVSGGTLIVGGNVAEGAGIGANIISAVTVSGGTLDLTHGSLTPDSFTMTGGTLKNVAAFAAATTGGLALQNSSTLAFDLDSSFSTLSLSGTLDLSAGSNLGLTLANGFVPAASYTLVDNDAADLITGTFGTLNASAFGPGSTFTLSNNTGSYSYQLLYGGGTGNDLVIQAVPEPSACAMMVLGVAGFFGARHLRSILRRGKRPQCQRRDEIGAVKSRQCNHFSTLLADGSYSVLILPEGFIYHTRCANWFPVPYHSMARRPYLPSLVLKK